MNLALYRADVVHAATFNSASYAVSRESEVIESELKHIYRDWRDASLCPSPRARAALLVEKTAAMQLVATAEVAVRKLVKQGSFGQATQARQVLDFFREAVSSYNVRGLPPLEATEASDGSFLIEWMLKDRRLGFNIEPQGDDSGWYFVSSKEAGGRCASGGLASLDIRQLLKWSLSPG